MSTPLAMPKKPATLTAKPLGSDAVVHLITQNTPESPAKQTLRPGLVEQTTEVLHDGIVKAKHIQPGQTVRAWLHNKPCGSERVVASVERIEDGEFVLVTFSTAHPDSTVKAAYRYFVADLVGTVVDTKTTLVPALVSYEEV